MIPNMWYPICRPQDVPAKEPVGMRRLGEDIVLFRDASGRVVCMQDRCAHKGAKLSAKLPGITRLSRNNPAPGRIACPYHGFEYDSNGDCVAIPALGENARIPKGMCLKTFKVKEKHKLIWMWHGDARSEEELPEIPMFERFLNDDTDHPSAYIPHDGPAPVHYSRWMESVSEFYHAPFLRWGTWVHYIQQYGIRGKYVHDDCKVQVNGNHIKSEIIQRHEKDRYPQGLERFLPWKSAWGPWKVEFDAGIGARELVARAEIPAARRRGQQHPAVIGLGQPLLELESGPLQQPADHRDGDGVDPADPRVVLVDGRERHRRHDVASKAREHEAGKMDGELERHAAGALVGIAIVLAEHAAGPDHVALQLRFVGIQEGADAEAVAPVEKRDVMQIEVRLHRPRKRHVPDERADLRADRRHLGEPGSRWQLAQQCEPVHEPARVQCVLA